MPVKNSKLQGSAMHPESHPDRATIDVKNIGTYIDPSCEIAYLIVAGLDK